MRVDNLRNIAIIAHVDHGKTTMVDKLLRATDAFRANQQVEDRVLDSNDQERGQLFVEPGTECYEGMIVGERSKAGDMVVNIARTKNLGNQRSSTSDISVQLVPPRTFSLEEALEYIADDELVEITPKNIRLRKRLLNATDRKKAKKN